eukprot:SAG11_NODE_189_length_13028_cov_14.222446_13_plen_166_part_00
MAAAPAATPEPEPTTFSWEAYGGSPAEARANLWRAMGGVDIPGLEGVLAEFEDEACWTGSSGDEDCGTEAEHAAAEAAAVEAGDVDFGSGFLGLQTAAEPVTQPLVSGNLLRRRDARSMVIRWSSPSCSARCAAYRAIGGRTGVVTSVLGRCCARDGPKRGTACA